MFSNCNITHNKYDNKLFIHSSKKYSTSIKTVEVKQKKLKI